MYAYQLPQPDPKRSQRPRRNPRPSPRVRSNPYREMAIEAGVKLTVNVVLSVVAVVALVKLLPYRSVQQSKLQELDVAVQTTKSRVNQVQASFRQYFDPSQSRNLMQQAGNRIDPNQRQIILQTPAQAQSSQTSSTSR